MYPWNLILSAWAVMAVVMTVMWLIQRRTGDAGIVDVAWSFAVGAISIVFALTADGWLPRRLIVATLAGIWGLRLGVYLFRRVRRLPEDGRYRAMRESWGDRAQTRLLGFFQIQAAWSVLFALPMLLASRNAVASFMWTDAVGVSAWLVSVIGASIADGQLARFRENPANRGKVCRDGLWSWSRHPNYFFEWIQWWCWVFLGFAAPWGWLTLLGPALMLFFLLKVTGIPPTEAQAIASRGDAYREYQRTTSAFFPWPPKRSDRVAEAALRG